MVRVSNAGCFFIIGILLLFNVWIKSYDSDSPGSSHHGTKEVAFFSNTRKSVHQLKYCQFMIFLTLVVQKQSEFLHFEYLILTLLFPTSPLVSKNTSKSCNIPSISPIPPLLLMLRLLLLLLLLLLLPEDLPLLALPLPPPPPAPAMQLRMPKKYFLERRTIGGIGASAGDGIACTYGRIRRLWNYRMDPTDGSDSSWTASWLPCTPAAVPRMAVIAQVRMFCFFFCCASYL